MHQYREHRRALVSRHISCGVGDDRKARCKELTRLVSGREGFDSTIVGCGRTVPDDGRTAKTRFRLNGNRIGKVTDHGIERICTGLTIIRNAILVTVQRESLCDITPIRNAVEVAVQKFSGEDLALVRNAISVAILF